MFDVIACGELLIDFVSTESGVTLAEAPAFKKAAGARRLTWRSAWLDLATGRASSARWARTISAISWPTP